MNPSVLNVNSSKPMCQLFQTILNKKYHVVEAGNVYDAARKIKKRPDVKVILIDVDKEVKETLEFIHHVHSSTLYSVSFILFTGNKDEALNEQLKLAGARNLFYKPFNPDEVIKQIDELASVN
jgi:DNA-binding NtrC family response regulator